VADAALRACTERAQKCTIVLGSYPSNAVIRKGEDRSLGRHTLTHVNKTRAIG